MTYPTKTYLAWLADMHRKGRMDRRQFISRSVAAGLTAPAITSLMTSSVLAAGPKKGGSYGTRCMVMSFPLRPAQFLYNFARVLGRTDMPVRLW